MYTVELVSDIKVPKAASRFVTVRFTDGEFSFQEEFRFSISEEVLKIKRAVKKRLDELNEPTEEIKGEIGDYTEALEPTPEPSDTAFLEWEADLMKLVAAKVAERVGLTAATPQQLTALTGKVQSGLLANRNDDRYVSALASYANLL